MIQQRNESIQGLFIDLLLVERPAQFIQGELVEGRTDTDIHDVRISVLGIKVALADKEVFSTPELHFIDISGPGEFADHPVHDSHGLFGLSQFLIRAGHLVQYLVVAIVHGVIVEQFLVKFNGLAGTYPFEIISAFGKSVRSRCHAGHLLPLGRPSFKVRLGLDVNRNMRRFLV